MTINDAFEKIVNDYNNFTTEKKKAIVVAGPTASGKTSLAISLANALNGEIISCDSMQIYKYMDIGTAKPTKEEQSMAIHHMIDFVEPWENFSAYDFVTLAKSVMNDVTSRGKIPVLSGGTGLYVSSIVDNREFSEGSKEEEELSDYYYKMAEEKGIDEVYKILEENDPEAALSIHKNNEKRVIRAVVMLKLTGLTQNERNLQSKTVESDYDYLLYILNPDRDVLYDRINRRVDIMMNEGLEEEIKFVLKKCQEAFELGKTESPLPGRTAHQAIGYKEFEEYFKGNLTLTEVADLIKLSSRRYAKRQLTWLRKVPDAIWLDIEY